jgi:transposase InsO family protein
MARGFVYLAVALDWFSRRVLAWRLSITMEAAFCIETLEDALARWQAGDIQHRPGLAVHWAIGIAKVESLPGLGCHADGQRVEVGLIGCL